jgi:hypothetical protein
MDHDTLLSVLQSTMFLFDGIMESDSRRTLLTLVHKVKHLSSAVS